MDGGYEPVIYYRVYGAVDTTHKINGNDYRFGGVPEGLSITALTRDRHHAQLEEILDEPMGGVLRACLPRLGEMVNASDNAMHIVGTVTADPTTLNYFRDTIGIVTWMLDHGGTFVYDPFQLKCWSADDWRTQVFSSGEPSPLLHCAILVSDDERSGRQWYHTRGLRKFGRPDISVRGVPRDFGTAVADLCARFIVYQAMGGVIVDGNRIRMKTLPEGASVTNQGDFDDPDFNNKHVDIAFPW